MFAYCWTWIIKQGRMEEALELTKAEAQRYSPDYAQIRCYTPSIGPRVFVYEVVVEDEEARDKWFAGFNARPEAAAYWEKWNSLAERMVSNERWNVTEL